MARFPKTPRNAVALLSQDPKPSLEGAPLGRLADFDLLREIGRGGMGSVYLARQRSLDRMVAVKVLSEPLAKDGVFVERFVREARASAKLNHANLIRGIAVGVDQGRYYFAMEYVDGPTISEKLRYLGGRLPEADALEIVIQVARALTHAWHHKMVHRDIKPDNIMLDATGLVKLCDLGLAKVFTLGDSGTTSMGNAIGTPKYMSPEQVRGEADSDIRGDIYSLGATFFHMVTGQPPFSGPSPAILMNKHLTETAPDPRNLNPKLSTALSRVILKMLQKDKQERYQNPEALLNDLEAIKRGELPPNLPPLRATEARIKTASALPIAVSEEKSTPKDLPLRKSEVRVVRTASTPGFPFGFIALLLFIAGATLFGLTYLSKFADQAIPMESAAVAPVPSQPQSITGDEPGPILRGPLKQGLQYAMVSSDERMAFLNVNWERLDHVLVGDLNDDGRDDLLLTEANGLNPRLYFSTDRGYEEVTVQKGLSGIALGAASIADLNNDGARDLVFFSEGGLRFIPGGGFPGFAFDGTRKTKIVDLPGIMQFLVLDLDGDGREDLVLLAGSSIYFVRNTGNEFKIQVLDGIIVQPSDRLIAVELNNDAYPELLLAGPRGLFAGQNRRGQKIDWQQLFDHPALNGSIYTRGDFNGDAFMDLIVCAIDGRPAVLINDRQGGLNLDLDYGELNKLENIEQLASADLDLDGDLDLLVRADGQLLLLWNDGLGWFRKAVLLEATDQDARTLLMQISGTGILDIVLGQKNERSLIFRGSRDSLSPTMAARACVLKVLPVYRGGATQLGVQIKVTDSWGREQRRWFLDYAEFTRQIIGCPSGEAQLEVLASSGATSTRKVRCVVNTQTRFELGVFSYRTRN